MSGGGSGPVLQQPERLCLRLFSPLRCLPYFLLSISLPPLLPSFTSFLLSLLSAPSHKSPYVCSEIQKRRGGGGGLWSPYVQQGNPFLTLIRFAIAKSAFTVHTLTSLIWIQCSKKFAEIEKKCVHQFTNLFLGKTRKDNLIGTDTESRILNNDADTSIKQSGADQEDVREVWRSGDFWHLNQLYAKSQLWLRS